jgi:L-aspartate oxidase
LYAVLHLPGDWDVVVVDKGPGGTAGSSPLAQGGMAVAVGAEDSPGLHAEDTLRVGGGIGDRAAVEALCHEGPEVLEHLLELGCLFDRTPDGSLHLAREGGQSVARSVHNADATGRELMRVVGEHARTRARRIIGAAVRLLVADGRCTGATSDGPVVVSARTVLMATGGCGALYAATTNAPASTGDGVAVACEAGAEAADMEFVQFHPTCLATGTGHQRVLLTEALRGEGAWITDERGERFLTQGELAPRDVVAREIAERGGAWLDARHLGRDVLDTRFPNVMAACASAGFDLGAEPVPIAPAAHYMLGGVGADAHGRTTLPGLYAAGECAASGVHGANRMAGNSLTEAVVFGRRAAGAMAAESDDSPKPVQTPALAHSTEGPGARDALRQAMWDGAGLVRTKATLDVALDAARETAAGTSDAGLRLAAVAAQLICRAALERTESRGVHYRADAPEASPDWATRRTHLSA